MAQTNSKTLVVKKAKKNGEKTYYQEVGKIVLRESGSGVLFLHFMDGEFAVFPKEPKPAPEAETAE